MLQNYNGFTVGEIHMSVTTEMKEKEKNVIEIAQNMQNSK